MVMTVVPLSIVAAALSCGLAACDRPARSVDLVAPPSVVVEANAIVEYVIDGDTIDVIIDGGEERVRLTGIDTPEIATAATPAGDRRRVLRRRGDRVHRVAAARRHAGPARARRRRA